MGFSIEWEEVYRGGGHMSIWPWTDVVTLVMRHAQPAAGARVLELGCGPGANIPFLMSLGYEYYSVEGSASAVSALVEKYPDVKNNIVEGDFTQELPFDGQFDLVLDRGSLTHNPTSSIERCIANAGAKLKPGGKFVCVDWFSRVHSEYGRGEKTDDPYTEKNFPDGQFAGLGAVHFATEEHIHELFSGYTLLSLEHTVRERILPDDGWVLGAYNFAVEKAS